MSANSARSLKPICELPDDYEIVILPDGTQIQRERQTKAQAKIQALKTKRRNEQLRKTLMSLSNAASKTTKKTNSINDQVDEIKHALHANKQIDTDSSVDSSHTKEELLSNAEVEMSAIQKQMIAKSENKTDLGKNTDTVKENKDQSAELKISKLKKLIFG